MNQLGRIISSPITFLITQKYQAMFDDSTKTVFQPYCQFVILKKKGGFSDDGDGIVSLFIQVRNCHSVWNKDNTFCGVRKQHDELRIVVAEDIKDWKSAFKQNFVHLYSSIKNTNS